MTKILVLSAALAAGALFAGSIGPATAAPSAPALDQGAAQSSIVADAAWSCGPRRCVWVPGYRGPVPSYAMGWGAPAYPHCYWKRGILGKWKQKCND